MRPNISGLISPPENERCRVRIFATAYLPAIQAGVCSGRTLRWLASETLALEKASKKLCRHAFDMATIGEWVMTDQERFNLCMADAAARMAAADLWAEASSRDPRAWASRER